MQAGTAFNRRALRGFTLVETMISAAIASVLILGTINVFLHIMRGDLALANYSEMNRQARGVLEQMSRDFRGAADISSCSASGVTVLVPETPAATTWEQVRWAYDPNTQQVTRTLPDGTSTVVARNVRTFAFSYYNTSGVATAAPVEMKQIQLSMHIVRFVQQTTTSEYVISAKFTLRAKSTTL